MFNWKDVNVKCFSWFPGRTWMFWILIFLQQLQSIRYNLKLHFAWLTVTLISAVCLAFVSLDIFSCDLKYANLCLLTKRLCHWHLISVGITLEITISDYMSVSVGSRIWGGSAIFERLHFKTDYLDRVLIYSYLYLLFTHCIHFLFLMYK